MGFHRRVAALLLALLTLLGSAAQAAGIEFIASDPVLYSEGKPIFIFEDLSASLGARRVEEGALAWLDIYGGETTALTATLGADAGGIYAALSGVPSAYGLSGGNLVALMGADSSKAALDLINVRQLAEEINACAGKLLGNIETGETESIQAALSVAATEFQCAKVAGKITSDDIIAALIDQPLLRGATALLQSMGAPVPEIGEVGVTGAYGFSGEGDAQSAVYRLAFDVAGAAYDADIVIDNSSAVTITTVKTNGGGYSFDARCETWPTGYASMKVSGGTDDIWFELEQARSPAGGYRMGGGMYDSETGRMTSLTVIFEGGDYYAAISEDISGVENSVYVSTDTQIKDEITREGMFTLGLYQAGSRTEIQGDLIINTSPDAGKGRKVEAAYASEIVAMTEDDWKDLVERAFDTLNGAMYVLRMNVPGYVYGPIEPLEIEILTPGEEQP